MMQPPEDPPADSPPSTPRVHEASRAGVLFKLLWWTATLALLVVCWGAIQFLALLIQAERLRGAMQTGLESAALPESTVASWFDRTEQELTAITGDAMCHTTYYLNGNIPPTSVPHAILWDANAERLLSVQLLIASDDLLPGWLGPRVIGITPENVSVREELLLP